MRQKRNPAKVTLDNGHEVIDWPTEPSLEYAQYIGISLKPRGPGWFRYSFDTQAAWAAGYEAALFDVYSALVQKQSGR